MKTQNDAKDFSAHKLSEFEEKLSDSNWLSSVCASVSRVNNFNDMFRDLKMVLSDTSPEAKENQSRHAVKSKIVDTDLWLLRKIKRRQLLYDKCGMQQN